MTLADGIILIWCADNCELAGFIENEPSPTAAKLTNCSFFEGCLEGFKGAEGSVDGASQRALRFA